MPFRYKPELFSSSITYDPQAVPVLAMLCRTAGVSRIIDQLVKWNDSNAKVSPGLLIESLLICILCDRKPLWRVERFWAKHDLAMIYPGIEISAGQLNDDAYGHALDKLLQMNMGDMVVSACSLAMLQAHEIGMHILSPGPHIRLGAGSLRGRALPGLRYCLRP